MWSLKVSELSSVTPRSQTLDEREKVGTFQKEERNQAFGAAEGCQTK